MRSTKRARCTALLTDPESLKAAAALELVDRRRGVLREAMVIYTVSPALPNAARLLGDGLKGRARAWKQDAAGNC